MSSAVEVSQQEQPMCIPSIKKKLQVVESASAYLTFLHRATATDHLQVKEGEQLRVTADYNGSLFEVVREPFEVLVDGYGKITAYEIRTHHMYFHAVQEEEAKEFYANLGNNPDIVKTKWEVVNFALQSDDSHSQFSEDEMDLIENEDHHYRITYWSRKQPENTTIEKRIWVRKCCLISKAEGLAEDKNNRSLDLSIQTVSLDNLVYKYIQMLNKIQYSLKHHMPHDANTKRYKSWKELEEKRAKLWELFCSPYVQKMKLTAYGNKKYGLFLKNPVSYTITASGANVIMQTVDNMQTSATQVKETSEKKQQVLQQLKPRVKDEGCLITDD